MAYRIVYGPEPSAARQGVERSSRRSLLTVCFFLLFLVLVRVFWPEGGEALSRLLLPGDPDVTREAVLAMAAQWKNGADLRDAFTAFCQVVLAHGTVY